MDAFAVAIAAGIKLKRINLRQNFRLAWHFGFFQAAMPVLGWTAGLSIRKQIASFDHWMAFGLLVWVAQGMLREAFKGQDAAAPKDPTKGATMVMLSLATSLDALAVGLSLSMIDVSIWYPSLAIGIVAAVFTTIGMRLGTRISEATLIRRYADCTGGVVLLVIGMNILREHGVFGG
ncbi:MAG: manganese efflux pump [Desulfobacteraceae bacterium]|nr:MAG: manganese efflux pump [Desulfobacteraceae bacterium]